jgi:hypothetical protein
VGTMGGGCWNLSGDEWMGVGFVGWAFIDWGIGIAQGLDLLLSEQGLAGIHDMTSLILIV